jgi:uncharacterized membrane protein YkoI
MQPLPFLALVGATLSIGCLGAQAASPSWTPQSDAVAYGKSKISLIQAIAVAERNTGGHAVHADFQVQRGKGIFEVETLANKKLTIVIVDAESDQVSESSLAGTMDAMSADQSSAITQIGSEKLNLESAAAQGDEMGDWAVDAGVGIATGKPAYRVDVLKDGKIRTVMIAPSSGKTPPPDGGSR